MLVNCDQHTLLVTIITKVTNRRMCQSIVYNGPMYLQIAFGDTFLSGSYANFIGRRLAFVDLM